MSIPASDKFPQSDLDRHIQEECEKAPEFQAAFEEEQLLRLARVSTDRD